MLNFISEKVVNGDTYTAYRNDENPSEVIVLKNGNSFKYKGEFNLFWINLK